MRARHRALARIGQDEAAVLGATMLTWQEEHRSSFSPPLFFQEEHTGEILISLVEEKKKQTTSPIAYFFSF